jgi:hypothetical protein
MIVRFEQETLIGAAPEVVFDRFVDEQVRGPFRSFHVEPSSG